jgi:hypothetical protein
MKLFYVVFLVLSGFAFADPLTLSETESEITIRNGEKTILSYQKADVQPPAGVDPVYIRSGFIHPLVTPKGGIVTGIHPDDHYHHLGLWHAWVKGTHEGKPVDFWNLKDKTGRVRFAKVASLYREPEKTGFTVEQEAVRYRDGQGGDPIVLLKEELTIIVHEVEDAYEVDYDYTQTNVTEEPLVLPAYRYGGGLAYRAPLDWNKDNSDYLTSEGNNRTNSHETRARWVQMHGPTTVGDAAVTVFCHPKNHDAPQRLRTWDNGKVFLNYVPIQETPWEIAPGQSVTHRYRLIIADGKMDKASVEKRWKRYAAESR